MSLLGTVAPTDYDWYDFLRRRQALDEVNFWRPSARQAVRGPEFSPFLFKLKRPHNAIAGFGFFYRWAPLPDWLAWECFGQANGCETFADMRARIQTIRARIGYRSAGGIHPIGCTMILDVTLFEPNELIAQPSDWPPKNLRPMGYDLEHGEGARIWAACLERARFVPTAAQSGPAGVSISRDTDHLRYGTPHLVRPRLGQGTFRIAVTQAYERACAVTREHSLPALEAAHIRPFSQDGPHEVRNGLLLRADLHRLFDQGYLTVSTEHRLEVSRRLRTDYENGHSYYPFQGAHVNLPPDQEDEPEPALLRWHNEHVFLS